MDLRRFFASYIDDKTIVLDGEEFRHCVQVTRHKVGYDFIATYGDGYDYLAKITQIDKEKLTAKIISKTLNKAEPKSKIILFQAVCKELDFIVQKAVELGVTDIYPFYSEHTNIPLVKTDRLKKIVLDASKQCGRGKLPIIYEPCDFAKAVALSGGMQNRILCYEKCSGSPLAKMVKPDANLALYIGSEGGFSDTEVSYAKEKGIKIASLGKRILRAETASIVGLTIGLQVLGEL